MRISIDVPPDVYERLDRRARALGLSVEELVSRLLARSDRELARDVGGSLWWLG